MAPDEKNEKDLEVEAVSQNDETAGAKNPEELTIDVETVDDVDVGPVLSAGSDDDYDFSDDADFEQDLDVDITGDPDTDFADEDDGDGSAAQGGDKLKKILAPALVLVIAAGIGGYIVMNPQVLGGGSASPEPEVAAYKAPDSDMFSASAPAADIPAKADITESSVPASAFSDAGGLPQPTVNQNEIPRGPGDVDDMPVIAAVDEEPAAPVAEGIDLTEVSEDMPLEQGSADISESVSVAMADEAGDLANELIQLKDAAAPAFPDAGEVTEAVDLMAAAEAASEPEAGDVTPVIELPAAPEPPAEPESFQLAQADISEVSDATPPVMTPAEKTPEPAPAKAADLMPSPQATQTQQAAKPAETAPQMPSKEVRQAADVYFDGAIPTGPMADVGPRKVDPVMEPASRFVVVKKTHEKMDMEATLAAANRALQLKRYESALDMFDSLYDKNPRDPRILMGRAVAQQHSGLTESAIRTYEALLEIDPKNADATVNMLGLLRQQYPSVALRRLMDLYNDHPDNAGIAAQIGVTQADLEQYDDALRYLGIASSLEPQNAQHMFNMAIIADRSGRTAAAIKYYEQALELDAVYSSGRSIPRETIYDRLATLRRR